MSSIRCVDLLRHAQENSYAVGYFEAWNLESLLAVVRAAEIARSPVMVGFCGEYLANPQRKFKEDINLYGAFAASGARCFRSGSNALERIDRYERDLPGSESGLRYGDVRRRRNAD